MDKSTMVERHTMPLGSGIAWIKTGRKPRSIVLRRGFRVYGAGLQLLATMHSGKNLPSTYDRLKAAGKVEDATLLLVMFLLFTMTAVFIWQNSQEVEKAKREAESKAQKEDAP